MLDIAHALVHDCERLEAEEVHLNQAHTLNHMSVVFGHEHALVQVLIFDATQRREVRQVVGSDDHAARVNTHLPNRSFQLLCVVEHGFDLRLAAIDQLSQLVHVLIAVLEVHLR